MGFFKDQVQTKEPVPGFTSYVMSTSVKDVITFAGSFVGGTVFSPAGNQKIASLTAAMLDKGTKSKDKYVISDMLESAGAELSFSSTRHHVQFAGHCLKNDLETVIKLLGEQLQTPAFPGKELKILKTRLIGNLERTKEDTKKQALIGFLRNLYPENHPNHRLTTDKAIDQILGTGMKDISTFHQKIYGPGNLNFAIVGDVISDKVNDLIYEVFHGWDEKNIKLETNGLNAFPVEKKEEQIHIPDKTSADMYLGQSVGIDRDHEDYYPLMMAIYILGGNFSARLMQNVRDKQGLTYGIGSSIGGVSFGNDGYWSTRGTFAPDLLDAGKEATMEQVSDWYNNGATLQELENKKTTLTGSFKVGMDSTGGLTAKILSNAEKNRSVEYLDQYPEIIRGITLKQVNNAIKHYIDPKKLTLVIAGTIDKASWT